MPTIQEIYEAIIRDPMNQEYSNRGDKPIFMAHEQAKVLIIGQAPGAKTKAKGVVFKDKSGDTLRSWLDVDEDMFYNSGLFSVLPLDFYYPGKGKTGDLPPRKDFAAKWHPQLLSLMPNIQVTILIGSYAQSYYLKERTKENLTKTVQAYEEYLPEYVVLVHPSPLNFRWIHKNPFFIEKTIPTLQAIIKQIIKNTDTL